MPDWLYTGVLVWSFILGGLLLFYAQYQRSLSGAFITVLAGLLLMSVSGYLIFTIN